MLYAISYFIFLEATELPNPFSLHYICIIPQILIVSIIGSFLSHTSKCTYVRRTIIRYFLPINLVCSVGKCNEKKKETLQVWYCRPPPRFLAVVAVTASSLIPMDAVAVAVAVDAHHLLFFSLSHHSPLIISSSSLFSSSCLFVRFALTNHLFV